MIIILVLVTLAIVLVIEFEQRLAAIFILFVVIWISSCEISHYKTATECQRLGKFYVGKTVFECKAIKEVEDK